MSDQFTIKDSGQRQSFAGGMVRDTSEGKVDFTTVLNGPMFDRWAAHLTKGEIKYPDPEAGRPNWMRAQGKEEYIRARKSAFRHFRQWMRGDTDEDHAAAVFFNINLAEYVKGNMTAGADVTPLMGYKYGAQIVRLEQPAWSSRPWWDVRTDKYFLSSLTFIDNRWVKRTPENDKEALFETFDEALAALNSAPPPPA